MSERASLTTTRLTLIFFSGVRKIVINPFNVIAANRRLVIMWPALGYILTPKKINLVLGWNLRVVDL